MEILGKALNKIDRVLLGLGIPVGLGLFIFSAPYFFRDPGLWGLLLFSLPMSIFMLGMAYVGLSSQLCWVSISGEEVVYRGLIKKRVYKWSDIEKTEYPFYLGSTTSYALFHLKTGKKTYIPCGDLGVRELLSTHVIEKMMNERIAEFDTFHDSGKPES